MRTRSKYKSVGAGKCAMNAVIPSEARLLLQGPNESIWLRKSSSEMSLSITQAPAGIKFGLFISYQIYRFTAGTYKIGQIVL